MGEKLHESDGLVIAGRAVPDDLAPLDRFAGSRVPALLRAFLALGSNRQAEVRALVNSFPQHERSDAVPPDLCARGEGPGPLVMRLLRNRNLNQASVAQAVAVVTRGRRYWAASTYGRLGAGLEELTPDLLGDLSVLLDLSSSHLETLTGLTPESRQVDVGDLVWDVRRLTRDQVEHVIEAAEAMSAAATCRASPVPPATGAPPRPAPTGRSPR